MQVGATAARILAKIRSGSADLHGRDRACDGKRFERNRSPVVKKNVEAFKGIDFDTAPPLLGYVATKSKDTSEVLLESKRKDPILARWQYGLVRQQRSCRT